MADPMTLEQLIDCMAYRTNSVTHQQIREAARHMQRMRDELASAQCVVRQVARDTYGQDMTVKEFADRAGYDS